MVEDFGVAKSPKDIAFYAGILSSSFSICQTTTVMFWGQLSDRIGRRPVLLIGLVGNFVTFLMFGFARSYTWALIARSLNGLLSGNVAVSKSVVAEISDNTNRSRCMAILPLLWNVGCVGGAAIGGLLADPVNQYPNLFGSIRIFHELPFLLPCLVGSMVTLFGIVYGFVMLEETLATKKARRYTHGDLRPPVKAGLADETTPLVSSETAQAADEPAAAYKRRTLRDLLTPTVVTVMVTNMLMCLGIACCDQIYPIFAATKTSDGGLGFDSRNIGISLAISGVVVLYLQLIMYPRLERKFGALYCYQQGQKVMIPMYLAMPCLSWIAARSGQAVEHAVGTDQPVIFTPAYAMLWILLLANLFLRVIGNVLFFTSVNLLSANLAPTTADLGLMNGAQQLAMSVTRVIGPVMAGYIWSWSIKHDLPYPFNAHLVWVICALLTAVSLYMTYDIPESVNKFAAIEVDEYGRPLSEQDRTE
ncbi:MFS general substrate transporter [Linderina pennispora]|uniref:MFS general substrate transporter n=1 Tax=Linderina pennispora TaxID=61395 RepID=A0A1Y1WBB9_9FUNG|nr:MFS general substrate transporter [Linderina pennispora]ORX70618.1 MFS general substrate transporter [Linderina pennispora]